LPATALARDAAISIPPTTLDVALMTLAREAGVEITSTEPGLRSVRTGPVQGSMPVRKALDRLLADTCYRAIAVAGGYRIVRAPARAAARRTRLAVTSPPSPRVPDIVVTASKQRVSLLRYPGSLMVTETEQSPPATTGTITDLAPGMPILQSTQLGAGRNKVFIRGIADSSFGGTTQSPTSIYLDDVQLTYSGPDPGLRLYDMRRIEILEGAQGTLYGSGAIGGVIRLTSNPVDLSAVAGAVSGGVTATQGGSTGFDVAGMVNLPVLKDRLGIRAVAYDVHDGGYLDDVGRGLGNVNQGDTIGGRLALRIDAADGWRVEASGAGQWIDTRDGQYAETAEGPLTRRSRIAQPFDNRLLFGRVTVTKDWDSGLRFFSATGIVGYRSTDQFDATPRRPPGSTSPPVIYTANRDKWLLSQEARLSRSLPNGNSWVAGFTLVRDQDILSRAAGSPGNPLEIIGVTNVTKAASLFGEAGNGRPNRWRSVGHAAIGELREGPAEPPIRPDFGLFLASRTAPRLVHAVPDRIPDGRAGGGRGRGPGCRLSFRRHHRRRNRDTQASRRPDRPRLFGQRFDRALERHPGRPDQPPRPTLYR
jgi:outer membrane receptor protein involved in Fe transport